MKRGEVKIFDLTKIKCDIIRTFKILCYTAQHLISGGTMRDQNNFLSTFFSNPISCAAVAVVFGFACYGYYYYQESKKRAIAAQATQSNTSSHNVSVQAQESQKPNAHSDSTSSETTPPSSEPKPDHIPLTKENRGKTEHERFFTQADLPRIETTKSNLSEYDRCDGVEIGDPGELEKKNTGIYRSTTP